MVFTYQLFFPNIFSVGTHGYMAPEVLSKGTAYDSRCRLAQILGRWTKDSVSERVKMSLDYNIKRGFWI